MKQVISTSSAPKAIGAYSQAIKAGNTVYISGQIPLDPGSMELVIGDFETQVKRVFDNLSAIAEAAGGSLSHVVKLTVYLVDMARFSIVNEAVAQYFDTPYPARVVVAVSALPKDAAVEIDAILVLGD